MSHKLQSHVTRAARYSGPSLYELLRREERLPWAGGVPPVSHNGAPYRRAIVCANGRTWLWTPSRILVARPGLQASPGRRTRHLDRPVLDLGLDGQGPFVLGYRSVMTAPARMARAS